MKVAILGANGNVGTELCLYLRREPDVEVIPIVRNLLGSAYLRDQNLECRVFDISDEAQAREALRGADEVVVSSYVFGSSPTAHRANRVMIDHAVRFSEPSSVVLYLSSVRALAWRVDRGTPRIGVPRSYDRNKRLMEHHLLKVCAAAGKTGIALRMGHVYGEYQPRTNALQELLRREQSLELQVAPDAASNVVHTITIADCVKVCARSAVRPGVYSLVNVPQWSWRKVFDFYNTGGTELTFNEKAWARPPAHRQALQGMWRYVFAHRQGLAELRQFMPIEVERKLQRRFSVRSAGSEIAALVNSRKTVLNMQEFGYRPMPGPFVPGLSETEHLLQGDLPAPERVGS